MTHAKEVEEAIRVGVAAARASEKADPTYEELREMLPGCMDCPVPTTDPNNLHAQMREVCVGCFLDGPHKKMTKGCSCGAYEFGKKWPHGHSINGCEAEIARLKADQKMILEALRRSHDAQEGPCPGGDNCEANLILRSYPRERI